MLYILESNFYENYHLWRKHLKYYKKRKMFTLNDEFFILNNNTKKVFKHEIPINEVIQISG